MSWLDAIFARFGDRLTTRFAGRSFALMLGLLLAGCGFHPLYAERNREVTTDLATVKITPLPERIGQVMTTELQDGFNPSGIKVPAQYVLSVSLTRTRADLLIRTDGTASRTQVTIYATYALRRLSDNAAVLSGTSRSFSGFDVVDNNYSNVVAGDDAELRAARDLSEQIRGRVAVYLHQQSETAAVKP